MLTGVNRKIRKKVHSWYNIIERRDKKNILSVYDIYTKFKIVKKGATSYVG